MSRAKPNRFYVNKQNALRQACQAFVMTRFPLVYTSLQKELDIKPKILSDKVQDLLERAIKHSNIDKCMICLGEKGGVPGNENILPDGTIMCDFCHAEYLRTNKAENKTL